MLLEKIQLEDDEKILIQVRKHWFIIGVQLCSLILIALIPPITILILHAFSVFEAANITFNFFSAGALYVYTVWLFMLWMAALSVWTNYYLDVWTITNKRFVAINQKRLFHRVTGSFRLERLQDMNVEINGIIATFLDYGTLEVETASGDMFITHGLPKPRELKALILKAADGRITAYQGNLMQAEGL